ARPVRGEMGAGAGAEPLESEVDVRRVSKTLPDGWRHADHRDVGGLHRCDPRCDTGHRTRRSSERLRVRDRLQRPRLRPGPDRRAARGRACGRRQDIARHPRLPLPALRRGLDRAIDSGLTALNVTMGITGIGMGTDDFRSLLHTMHGYFCYFDLEPDRLLHIRTTADLERAKGERKLGIIFGCQGLDTKIDGDASLLLIMAKLGQRIVQLTYNERGAIGCGALEPNDTGLTEFGRICIREINECGMIVDLAHAGQATALQAIEFCAMPPIVSHANACAVTDHPRNLRDDVLRALAAKG